MVSRPDGVTLCEEKSLPATFSCPLDTTGTDIDDDDIRWHRFVRDRNATKKVDTDGEDITVVTSTTGAIINSTLTINNTRKSDTGFVWVVAQSHVYCNTSLTIVSSTYVNRVYAYVYVHSYKASTKSTVHIYC